MQLSWGATKNPAQSSTGRLEDRVGRNTAQGETQWSLITVIWVLSPSPRYKRFHALSRDLPVNCGSCLPGTTHSNLQWFWFLQRCAFGGYIPLSSRKGRLLRLWSSSSLCHLQQTEVTQHPVYQSWETTVTPPTVDGRPCHQPCKATFFSSPVSLTFNTRVISTGWFK